MTAWKRKEVIGDATLYLGDSRELLAELPNGCADMIFTDPPYGHNNNNGDLIHNREAALGRGNSGEARPIAGDDSEGAAACFEALLRHVERLLASGGCCCCCGGGGGPDPMFARWSLALDKVLDFKQMVVWDKGPMGMGWHYRRSYETVLVAQKRGAACKWYDTSSSVENIIRPGALGENKILPNKEQHPIQKPVELGARFILLHSQAGEIVLDPFMGSGTTGVACANLGRKFIGIEIEPKYFDIACKRISLAMNQQKIPLGE